MHPRLFPANERVAHSSLSESVGDVVLTDGVVKTVAVPIADFLRKPNGPMDCQLRMGAAVLVLEEHQGWAFAQSIDDSYVGYIEGSSLSDHQPVSHKVTSFGSHVYAEPSLKTRPLFEIPFMAKVNVTELSNGYARTSHGYIPSQHLSDIADDIDDPISTTERHLGVPYLWGGDSNWGLDCSGLVQVSFASAGVQVLRDADMQEESLGSVLAQDKALQRGDIVFWKGHVGLMRDADTLIHANAHHMAVTSEDFGVVCERIIRAGGGPVTARKRV